MGNFDVNYIKGKDNKCSHISDTNTGMCIFNASGLYTKEMSCKKNQLFNVTLIEDTININTQLSCPGTYYNNGTNITCVFKPDSNLPTTTLITTIILGSILFILLIVWLINKFKKKKNK